MEGSEGEGGGQYRFQALVHRDSPNRNGVGVLIDKSLKNGVVGVR